MSQKIIVGPFSKGLRNDIPPFYIDNESFPQLVNAFQWRSRVRRKRGTEFLTRLERYFDSTNAAYTPSSPPYHIVLDGSGNGNLFTSTYTNGTTTFTLEATGNIKPGTVTLVDTTSSTTYTDPTQDGYLTPTGTGGLNTINYSTGAIHINGGAGHSITAVFNYFPGLPVMDIEELNLNATQFPQTLAFDTKYSYQVLTSSPYYSYDVSFYKNPPSATYINYVAKASPTPVKWHGQNYQQFWSVNHENALWATNGITVPFTTANIGMQFKPIVTVDNITAGPPASADLAITAHGLLVGDFVFINEVLTTTGINLQTGYVISVVNANKVRVEFPNATLATNGTGGIAQYLTSSAANPNVDPIRWYDGDPTGGQESAPTFTGLGWVNFSPPIYLNNGAVPAIGDLQSIIYYLVGARMIIPYKDRLLFLGVVVQSSGTGPFYLQDTIVWSQAGSPYYTASFAYSTVVPSTSVFAAATTPILTPAVQAGSTITQSAIPIAYAADVQGFGGWLTAGYAQPITTVGYNQDVLLVGFTNRKTKLLFTGSDLFPFQFYIINSELGDTATFGTVTLDRGLLNVGDRGFTITDQQSSARFDLEIPDQVFQFDLLNNGTQRITSIRDFTQEWVYFTYPASTEQALTSPFPNQTLFYNYRDQSWALFNESYTAYGPFRRVTGVTWLTIGNEYPSWLDWNQGWTETDSSLEQPEVLGGNQQGFILVRLDGTTGEGTSLSITAVSISSNVTTVTSPSHGLNTGDFVYFTGALGLSNFNSNLTNSPVSYIIWKVDVIDVDTFTISGDPELPIQIAPSGTYRGNGLITRLYVPFIQSKQFPTAWGMSRKTRLGPQRYLLTTNDAPNSQVTLNIYLSQNAGLAFNTPPYVPDSNSTNNSVIYSNVMFTCQEPNNLQQLVADQAQTWHRQNTSLIGDTVQVAITMSDEQMFGLYPSSVYSNITGATQANPCVLTVVNQFAVGSYIFIMTVGGMTQLNNNNYLITAANSTSVTINVDSTAFTAYTSGGFCFNVTPAPSTGEIELHGMILDVSPSQVLA